MNAGHNNEKPDGNHIEENDIQNQVSTLCTQDKLALSSWGLPEKVLQHYIGKKITHMFPWQLECLTIGKVLEGGNLVFSAPTSAGKTLVAEILIAQTIFERQKKVILILPFVSVVREKMFYFQNMFSMNGIKVEGFMGGHSSSAGFKHVHMAVCTIEKANSIINRLLEEKDLSSLGLVVVDELHLLGDPYRGYLLELLLTKLKYVSSKFETNIQIVGMSATLPNLKVIADWLKADLYYSSYRPIPLSETLKCGTSIYDKKLNKIKEIVPTQSEIPDCPDQIGQLCLETIKNGHSVLIFCSSKAWCENLAEEIALFIKRLGSSKAAAVEGSPGWILRSQLSAEKISKVIDHLKMTPVGVDNNLQKTIAYGVAFHHAGLTLDERDIIEGSFKNGSIRVLCATSTLSSGVNLPARRVIIRSPLTYGSVMDVLTYRQMIGRAGRMGVDSEGESILICKPTEKVLCQQLMTSNLKPIESCLGRGTLSSSLKRALLEVVASGIASTPKEVKEYANCTFLASSSKHNLENPLNSCIEFLEDNEFIRLQENGTVFVATPLGQACLASSMPPDEGLSLFRELQRARRCFVLDTDLHIIYQVTPYSVSEQWSKLDWLHVLSIFESLPESMKRVGDLVGVEEQFLVRVAKGSLNQNAVENRIKMSIHRRFYTALALQDLVNEISLTEVAEKYQCNKGTLQSLQQSAATYAGMVTEFTKRLGWQSVELIFSQFQERLQFGVQRDLCELMKLPLLNVVRARALFRAGYTNLVAVANASASNLENILYSSIPFETKKDIAGETSFERNERNKLQTIWITGQADLPVRRAAELLIEQARNVIEMEIGIEGAVWSSHSKLLCNLSSGSESSMFCEAEEKVECGSFTVLSAKQEELSLSKTISEIYTPVGDVSTLEEKDITLVNNALLNQKKFDDCSVVDEVLLRLNSSCKPVETNSLEIENENELKNFEHKPYLEQNIKVKGCLSHYTGSNSEYPVNKEVICNTKKDETDYFASSFNIDNVLNISQNLLQSTNIRTENTSMEKSGKIDETDISSNCSESSVEVLFEKPNTSELYEMDKMSGDMFAIEGTRSFNVANVETSLSGDNTTNQFPDNLFSQSLTFDTQVQRMLDNDGIDILHKETIVKRCTSFNSDDLGFVSDFSPPKLNNIANTKIVEEALNKSCFYSQRQIAGVANSETPKHVPISSDSKLRQGDLRPRSREKNLKRKNCVNESPDFIIGSDDSLIEDGHVNKKVKVAVIKNKSKTSEYIENQVKEESDSEIMPTPKSIKINTTNSKRIKSMIERKEVKINKKGLSRTKSQCAKEVSNKSIGRKAVSKTICNASTRITWDKINIINVTRSEDVFESYCEELKLQNIIGLSLGCRKMVRERKSSIGEKIKKKNIQIPLEFVKIFHYKDIILDGIAIYYKGNDVTYISFEDECISVTKKIDLLKELTKQIKIFRMFDAKEQIKLMLNFISVFLEGSFQDPKIANWLLSKTWKEKSFATIVNDYIPEAVKLTSQLGPLLGFTGPGLYSKSSVSAKSRACLEAFLSFHVLQRQLRFLQRKSLLKLFEEVEMSIIPGLAEMELRGFRFDRHKIMDLKNSLDYLQSKLTEKAHSFAKNKFSLSSTAVLSKLLYNDLKLGKSENFITKKHHRPSTSKDALQELAVETNHPLPDIILNWRKLQAVSTRVLSPLLQLDPDTTRLFSSTLMFTATGRLSMHEPNLQNMPRNFGISIGNEYSDINVREIFVPSEGCVLLSVDFCQIELRLLAHFSEDDNLINSINGSTDIFSSIASHIYDVSESNVTDELRQNAKKMSYGIIYGIGARALSHQLRVEESVAQSLIQDFHNKFKGVTRFLEYTLKECKRKGYVKSLLGRRRYLSYINDSNPTVRCEAERQAINTVIQGSAADVLKLSLVKIRAKIKELNEENLTLNLLLHLHDELLFEVGDEFLETIASIMKETMENIVVLKVPIPVKLHFGPSWGQMRPCTLA